MQNARCCLTLSNRLCSNVCKFLNVQVNYINAHATSTLVGDVAEVKAIKKVFANMEGVKVNGTKSLIGHCLGAAGGLEAVAVIQAIRTGWLHPTLNQVGWALIPWCLGMLSAC